MGRSRVLGEELEAQLHASAAEVLEALGSVLVASRWSEPVFEGSGATSRSRS
jgi:hypothetical protein